MSAAKTWSRIPHPPSHRDLENYAIDLIVDGDLAGALCVADQVRHHLLHGPGGVARHAWWCGLSTGISAMIACRR